MDDVECLVELAKGDQAVSEVHQEVAALAKNVLRTSLRLQDFIELAEGLYSDDVLARRT